MRLTVIIPARTHADQLKACLDAIAASELRPDQVIVVDDASPQPLGEMVQRYGYEVLRHQAPPRGPAVSRNLAAAAATGDVLVMIDADVVVHRDALGRMKAVFESSPNVAAVFGSYDDHPAVATIVSRYRNLLHHHTHQRGHPEARTFWAGCGAVRKTAFDAVGGFSQRFTGPSIEDIDLGRRLYRAGYCIRLCRRIQATHLKRWTLPGMIRTDICARAMPWTRLLMEEGSAGQADQVDRELNHSGRERVSALLAWLMILLTIGGVFLSWFWLAAAAGAAVAWTWLNRDFFRLLARRGGLHLLAGGAGLHLLYYLYASATFVVISLEHRIRHPIGHHRP